MKVQEVCRCVGCERFHVYLAIKRKVIKATKDDVGRLSISQNQITKLSKWYDELPKRKRTRKKRIRKGYLYAKEKTKVPNKGNHD